MFDGWTPLWMTRRWWTRPRTPASRIAITRNGRSASASSARCSGSSLGLHLADEALALRPFLVMAIRLAGVLGRVHQRRVIHKGVHPSNIGWDPRTGESKISDFGHAV